MNDFFMRKIIEKGQVLYAAGKRGDRDMQGRTP